MAFHVACPITCRKICYCTLGFPRDEKGKNDFLQEAAMLEQFLSDPWLIKAKEKATVQVQVPKVVVVPAPPPPSVPAAIGGGDRGVEAVALPCAQVKRVPLQKQAALTLVNSARKLESGNLQQDAMKNATGEEQAQLNDNLICQLCFSGEYELSERGLKMSSCNTCAKKYHRSCLRAWSQNRDLFHWSSWTCPSCRVCEVCQRTGDPTKFMFCKRCDGAYHCYCQQPPHKNVSHGPYLCPKHTRCHSCGSSVPGNGLSVRWFLGYTCCDACGRLFVKGNYCPVCLKVYRESESTPMVCCDICERWVHCPCDGISDAKYMEFQVDGNLQYVCRTCRGECKQVKNLDEAALELWRRRDEADRELIASLRAAAGLPTQEEIFDISPFSDDEEEVFKNQSGHPLRLSLKGSGDKSSQYSKEYGNRSSKKKSGKKKRNEISLFDITEAQQSLGDHSNSLFGNSVADSKNEELRFYGESDNSAFLITGDLTKEMSSVNETKVSDRKFSNEDAAIGESLTSRIIKIKSNKPHGLSIRESFDNDAGMSKIAKGPKLVIHLGGRSRNIESLATSEASNIKMGLDSLSSVGDKVDDTQLKEKISRLIKIKNPCPETLRGKYESVSPMDTQTLLGKRSTSDRPSVLMSGSAVPTRKRNKNCLPKHAEDVPSVCDNLVHDKNSIPSMSKSLVMDRESRTMFKIPKEAICGTKNSLPLHGKDEMTYGKGQRSKRRRALPSSADVDENKSLQYEDNTMNEFMDANWILQKLGKDAAGKRVEVHQSSNNSWHRGTVVQVLKGTSTVSITLDDGKTRNFELGEQLIRFIPQKQKC